ncbi:MAG TPA: secondary thiamine-phosphate synthase enzyme YjbQ [Acidobacteriota bacterium]|nr:secondary thiamine-phosphate synthase enzyme YjbQ [Acidobacteriota bacterium]
MSKHINVSTQRKIQLIDITQQIEDSLSEQGVREGLCIVYCPHTTAGLIVNEGADPDVASDLERAFAKAVPSVHFDHVEGNSPAHFLSSITGSSLQLLISGSKLQLGRWQRVFFCEFDGPRQRSIWLRVSEDH